MVYTVNVKPGQAAGEGLPLPMHRPASNADSNIGAVNTVADVHNP
jgi:hypothetical protein